LLQRGQLELLSILHTYEKDEKRIIKKEYIENHIVNILLHVSLYVREN